MANPHSCLGASCIVRHSRDNIHYRHGFSSVNYTTTSLEELHSRERNVHKLGVTICQHTCGEDVKVDIQDREDRRTCT